MLWGLLEFADHVRVGRTTEVVRENMGRLPTPIAERHTGSTG